MKIWIVGESELPLDDSIRLERTGMLARYLSENGHEVVWWASSFEHGEKQYLVNQTTEFAANEHELIIMLHSKHAYKKNISFSRIRYHNMLAKEFNRRNRYYQVPDIILVTWPTRQNAQQAVEYGKKLGIPVIIDVKDMWPDIFTRAFPSIFEPIANVALLPMKILAKKTFAEADGIVGVMPHVVKWACNYAGRVVSNRDRCIFLGNDEISLSESDYKKNKDWLEKLGVTDNTWNIVFFSTLSRLSLDLETAIRAISRMSKKYPSIRLIIGGKGDDEDRLKHLARSCSNIIFAGWLNEVQMNTIMRVSKCGLYCLKNTVDLKDTFSNKAIQYLSAGLPVISSLEGFSKDFIKSNNMGLYYTEGNEYDFERQLLKLYENEKLRQTMAENGYNVFRTYFSSSVVNEQFEDYLLSFVD